MATARPGSSRRGRSGGSHTKRPQFQPRCLVKVHGTREATMQMDLKQGLDMASAELHTTFQRSTQGEARRRPKPRGDDTNEHGRKPHAEGMQHGLQTDSGGAQRSTKESERKTRRKRMGDGGGLSDDTRTQHCAPASPASVPRQDTQDVIQEDTQKQHTDDLWPWIKMRTTHQRGMARDVHVLHAGLQPTTTRVQRRRAEEVTTALGGSGTSSVISIATRITTTYRRISPPAQEQTLPGGMHTHGTHHHLGRTNGIRDTQRPQRALRLHEAATRCQHAVLQCRAREDTQANQDVIQAPLRRQEEWICAVCAHFMDRARCPKYLGDRYAGRRGHSSPRNSESAQKTRGP